MLFSGDLFALGLIVLEMGLMVKVAQKLADPFSKTYNRDFLDGCLDSFDVRFKGICPELVGIVKELLSVDGPARYDKDYLCKESVDNFVDFYSSTPRHTLISGPQSIYPINSIQTNQMMRNKSSLGNNSWNPKDQHQYDTFHNNASQYEDYPQIQGPIHNYDLVSSGTNKDGYYFTETPKDYTTQVITYKNSNLDTFHEPNISQNQPNIKVQSNLPNRSKSPYRNILPLDPPTFLRERSSTPSRIKPGVNLNKPSPPHLSIQVPRDMNQGNNNNNYINSNQNAFVKERTVTPEIKQISNIHSQPIFYNNHIPPQGNPVYSDNRTVGIDNKPQQFNEKEKIPSIISRVEEQSMSSLKKNRKRYRNKVELHHHDMQMKDDDDKENEHVEMVQLSIHNTSHYM